MPCPSSCAAVQAEVGARAATFPRENSPDLPRCLTRRAILKHPDAAPQLFLLLLLFCLLLDPAGAQTPVHSISFLPGSFFTSPGSTGYATLNIPIPEVAIQLRDASGSPIASHTASIYALATAQPPVALLGNTAPFINGIARLSGLAFAELPIADPTLAFTVVLPDGSPVADPVNASPLLTGGIAVVPRITPGYGVRFRVAPPAEITHDTPVAPAVAVEVVDSAGQPDPSVSQGSVAAVARVGGTPVALQGDTARIYGGAAVFPNLRVVGYTSGELSLTFTVQAPGLPRINLATLSATPAALRAKQLHSLRFATSGSFWVAEGEAKSFPLQATLSPPPILHIVDSLGQLSAGAADSTGVTIVATAATQGGARVPLVGATAVSEGGVARFPALRTDGFVGGAESGVIFTFSVEGVRAAAFSDPDTSTGLNPARGGAFSLRFAPSGSVFTSEFQPASTRVGEALGPVSIQLLDSNGELDTSSSGISVDAFYNNTALLTSAEITSGVATLSVTLPPSAAGVVNLTFSARLTDPSSGGVMPLVQARKVTLRTGWVNVIPVAASIRFGGVSTGSAVTASGGSLSVSQGREISMIVVQLVSGDGSLDTLTTNAEVKVVATNGTLIPASPGGDISKVAAGEAKFSGLRFTDAPLGATLRFTVVTPGLLATGLSVETGPISVRGAPHHIGRFLPYPTGAVLGVVTQLKLAVFDINGAVVDAGSFTPPIISLTGGGVLAGIWASDSMIQTTVFTLGAPLAAGGLARLTYTPTPSDPSRVFDPTSLVVILALSEQNNSVVASSFIDPYTIPTVARVGETVSIRVELQDSKASPAPDGDAAYVTVSEIGGSPGGLQMLHSTSPAVGGIQTVDFTFGGSAPRDTTAVFATNLPGKSIPELRRLFRVLPGDASAILIDAISNAVSPGAVPVVAVGDILDITFHLTDSAGNRVSEQGISFTAESGDTILSPEVTQVGSTATDSLGDASLRISFSGTPAPLKAVRVAALQRRSIEATSLLFEVVSGRPASISVSLPSVAISREAVWGSITVLDSSGNLARNAGLTQFDVAPGAAGVFTGVSVTPRDASSFGLQMTPGDVPGDISLQITPRLPGVVFSPASTSRDVTVVTPQFGVSFDPLQGAVRSPGQPISATIGSTIEPPIRILISDSQGGGLLPRGGGTGLQVVASISTSTSTSAGGGSQATLNGGVAPVISGVAEFSALSIGMEQAILLRAQGFQSAVLLFTVGTGGVAPPPPSDPAVVGKSVRTGGVTLNLPAETIRFAPNMSAFTSEGQGGEFTQGIPLSPPVRVVLLDSAGGVDTLSETAGGAGGSPPLTVEATATSGVSLSGGVAEVVGGVAIFHSLAFASAPLSGTTTLSFQAKGLPAGSPALLKVLSTGPLSISPSPRSVGIRFDPQVASTFTPEGYLVHSVVNTVPIDVLDASGSPAPTTPPSMKLYVAAPAGVEVGRVSLTASRFTVPLLPSPGVGSGGVITSTAGSVRVAFTPSLHFTSFEPAGVLKNFTICAGAAAGVVFPPDTPEVISVGEVTWVKLLIVDSSGASLSTSWSAGCQRAWDNLKITPPAPEGILASTNGGGSIRQAAGVAVFNNMSVIYVPLSASAAQGFVDVPFSITGGPGGMSRSATRRFRSANPEASRVVITPGSGGSPTEIPSGGSRPSTAEVQSSGGTVVTTADAISFTGSGDAGITLVDQSVALGVATLTLRATGPPRVAAFAVTPQLQGVAFTPGSTEVPIRVIHANATLGVYTSQFYQIFPNTAYGFDSEFASDLAGHATRVGGSSPGCPISDICREVAAGNIQIVPDSLWPVPPEGVAIPRGSLPSQRGYVFRFITSERSNIERVESALRRLHTDPTEFATLQHSSAQAVKFLGELPGLSGKLPGTPPPGTPCEAFPSETLCLQNGCSWGSDGRCASGGNPTNCAGLTESICGSTSGCLWDPRESGGGGEGGVATPSCITQRDADGDFASDFFGGEWWAHLLIGAALLLLLCCCAALCRVFLFKPETGKEAGEKKNPTDTTPPPPPPDNPAAYPPPYAAHNTEGHFRSDGGGRPALRDNAPPAPGGGGSGGGGERGEGHFDTPGANPLYGYAVEEGGVATPPPRAAARLPPGGEGWRGLQQQQQRGGIGGFPGGGFPSAREADATPMSEERHIREALGEVDDILQQLDAPRQGGCGGGGFGPAARWGGLGPDDATQQQQQHPSHHHRHSAPWHAEPSPGGFGRRSSSGSIGSGSSGDANINFNQSHLHHPSHRSTQRWQAGFGGGGGGGGGEGPYTSTPDAPHGGGGEPFLSQSRGGGGGLSGRPVSPRGGGGGGEAQHPWHSRVPTAPGVAGGAGLWGGGGVEAGPTASASSNLTVDEGGNVVPRSGGGGVWGAGGGGGWGAARGAPEVVEEEADVVVVPAARRQRASVRGY